MPRSGANVAGEQGRLVAPFEVIEPYETYGDVTAKVCDWLECGVRLLIVIDLGKQSAIIRRSLTESMHIDINGALDGGTVVPGWTLPLRDLFVP